MSKNALKNVYEFSYAESTKTFLILLSQAIEQAVRDGLDQHISVKDHIKQLYEIFTNEIHRAAHLSSENYLKNASGRLKESLTQFNSEEINNALLEITKAISEATTQASRSLEAIEQEL